MRALLLLLFHSAAAFTSSATAVPRIVIRTAAPQPHQHVTANSLSQPLPPAQLARSVTVIRGGAIAAKASPIGKTRQIVQSVASFLDRRYFLVGAVATVALAACAPSIGRTGGILRPELTIGWGATCSIFLLSGLTLPTSELATAAFRLREHAAIQLFNLGFVPLVAIAICAGLRAVMVPALRDGILAMAVLPTTINMCVALTRSAGGNEALAIFNAVIGNLLGVFVTPLLLLALLGSSGTISVADTMMKLAKKVVLPLIAGQLLRPVLGKVVAANKKACSRTSETLLLAIIYTTFCDTFLRGFGLPPATLAVMAGGIAASHAAFLAASWKVASAMGLTMRDRVAFSMCSTHKTLALGLPLLKIIFQGRVDLAVLVTPLLLQHPLQLIGGSLVAPRLKALVEAEELEGRK